ncbi:MAG: EamA family transporter [Chitinophagaceae bacterium]|nr:MAG: EamA family transporter [Chitinophagaceae bacterium]
MWIIWAILAALSASLVIIFTKVGLKNVDPSVAFAIQAILIILICWSVVLFQGKQDMISEIQGRDWIYLILAGIATTLATLFSFKALSMGPASVVVTIERSSLIFTLIFAAIFLKEELNWKVLTGAGLILAGAVFIAFSEK